MLVTLPQQTQIMIQEMIAQMPDHFQATFALFDWESEVARIGAKHRLGVEQTQRLIVETAMVMFTLEDPIIFIQELKNHLGVSEPIAKKIAEDISDRVFDRLQEVMIEEHRDEIEFMQGEVSRLLQEEGQESSFSDLGIELGVLKAGDVILTDDDLPEEKIYEQTMAARAIDLTEVGKKGRQATGLDAEVDALFGRTTRTVKAKNKVAFDAVPTPPSADKVTASGEDPYREEV
jgi:hypothetical protein